ncbi:hypothetical protein FRC08_006914 [Ceratobasidium sp. 394]|nr:hypothetical protein FRC08_006914 [Ceratobasidium sp. 394]
MFVRVRTQSSGALRSVLSQPRSTRRKSNSRSGTVCVITERATRSGNSTPFTAAPSIRKATRHSAGFIGRGRLSRWMGGVIRLD